MTKTALLTIVTRNSPLAIWQAEYVQRQLKAQHPDITIKIITHVTKGDKTQDRSLADIGGKNLFVKDLQKMLLHKKADIAIHSIKDMSVQDSSELLIAAYCMRDDPRDVLVSNEYEHLQDLQPGAVIGTTSPRRQSQLLAIKPDVMVKPIRGNVGTRLKKLDGDDYDAIILASAGLKRLKLNKRIKQYLQPPHFIPAIGQGIIGIECRSDDENTQDLVAKLDDHATRVCATAERAVNRKLKGDCFTPLAAYATLKKEEILLHAIVGSLDGKQILRSKKEGSIHEAEALGVAVADDLLAQGAQKLITGK